MKKEDFVNRCKEIKDAVVNNGYILSVEDNNYLVEGFSKFDKNWEKKALGQFSHFSIINSTRFSGHSFCLNRKDGTSVDIAYSKMARISNKVKFISACRYAVADYILENKRKNKIPDYGYDLWHITPFEDLVESFRKLNRINMEKVVYRSNVFYFDFDNENIKYLWVSFYKASADVEYIPTSEYKERVKARNIKNKKLSM